MSERVRGRLAPSPTGALHVGNTRSFMIAWLSARAQGGQVILRMEDLDHPKVKPRAALGAYEDLAWLGLDWDEGPDRGGPHAPYVQTERAEIYRERLEFLRGAGLIYPCVCTRRDVESAQSAPHAGEEVRYPGTCRDRFASAAAAERVSGRPPAWRFRVDDRTTRFADRVCGEQSSRLDDWSGDFVVAKGRDQAAYQLAVVIDDALMEITEVIRADDLLASTHRQLALYEALRLPAPTFTHVPLVVGADGRRLAKRHGDTRIAALRAAGIAPARIIGALAASCGWAEPGACCAPRDLLSAFDLATIPRAPLVIDPARWPDG